MKTTFRKLAVALAATAGLSCAHAGVLTWQDVVFTTSWSNNLLTLEIDAAERSGDWTKAATLGALSIKDIGRFDSVSLKAAPKGLEQWTMNANELNGNGCVGGSHAGAALCLTGTPIKLTDNMVFTFAFTGAPVFDEPHLKVQFFDARGKKAGDLLSKQIERVVIPAPGTPVTPPPTPPGTPDTPPVVEPPVVVVEPPVVMPPLPDLPASGEVPEPQTLATLLAGLALMGFALRKRR